MKPDKLVAFLMPFLVDMFGPVVLVQTASTKPGEPADGWKAWRYSPHVLHQRFKK